VDARRYGTGYGRQQITVSTGSWLGYAWMKRVEWDCLLKAKTGWDIQHSQKLGADCDLSWRD